MSKQTAKKVEAKAPGGELTLEQRVEKLEKTVAWLLHFEGIRLPKELMED